MNFEQLLTFDTIVLSVCAVVALITAIKWHLDPEFDFNLQDLMVDHKTRKLSLFKIGQFFALLISTWILIHETRLGRLTEFLFTGYMAVWSGSNLMSKYLDNKRKQDKERSEGEDE